MDSAKQANGNLSEEEFKQVLSWLKQAAQQEHPEACYCMGALMEKNHPEVACKYYGNCGKSAIYSLQC